MTVIVNRCRRGVRTVCVPLAVTMETQQEIPPKMLLDGREVFQKAPFVVLLISSEPLRLSIIAK